MFRCWLVIVDGSNDSKRPTVVLGRETGHGVLGETTDARDQIVLFSPTLDDSISDDHPVRLLATIDRIEENFGRKPAKMLADTAQGRASTWRAWKNAAWIFTRP